MLKLREFLANNDFPTDLPLDGKMHRFDREGELSGWFLGHESPLGEKTVALARMGDWKSGLKLDFADHTELNETEAAELLLVRKETEKRLASEIKAGNDQTAKYSALLWDAAHGPNGHTSEYLRRKKLDGFFGAKTITTDELRDHLLRVEGRTVALPSGHINLLIPCRDVSGKIWGIQTIRPDGQKNMKPGQYMHGVFHALSPIEGAPTIYLCEGFATAASVQMATGKPAVCAFNAGNLPKVAAALSKKYPNTKIIIAGDDDRFTVLKDGTRSNAGRDKAVDAANSIGAGVVFPSFASENGKPTDWNDLHIAEGLEAVRNQLAAFELKPANELIALSGKMDAAKHQRAATHLLSFYGERIRKQDRDLFVYTGTHWKNLGVSDCDRIRIQLQTLLGNQATASILESAYKLFVTHVASVPEGVDLFTPPTWAANFLNGTLFVDKTQGGNYQLNFRAHDANDWLINVLPYNYSADSKHENPEFQAMLGRIFEGDSDASEKVRALRQMYGACLLPAFPHLFMLYGPPGTGKSTAIILASKLVHRDNSCSVDPTEFEGFNMETMAGKLVNFDTDIEMHKPISEKQIKKIVDRLPFRIRRKGVRDIMAPVPATHLFGGNGIPKTLDGASRAQDRRWTFIAFNAIVAKGQYDVDYVDYCFRQSPEGILNFALAGLRDLLDSRGHFLNPASGKADMEKWQLRTDAIGRFFSEMSVGDIDDNNCRWMVGSTAKIPRKKAWEVFKEWLKECETNPPRIGRTDFFARVRAMKFVEKTIRGVDYFEGFGVGVVEGAGN